MGDKTKLHINEENFLPLSYCDICGKLFILEGKLYRGISAAFVQDAQNMFSSGLIESLIRQGLFPKSKITQLEADSFPLIIEHELIPRVSYSYEWTFEMLKAAAITTLQVNDSCRRFGYELKDAHPDNIVFNGTRPLFVDLGSIVKKTKIVDDWQAAERFYQSFIYPLRLWKKCGEFVARRLLMGNEYLPHVTYFLMNYPVMRSFDHSKLSRLLNLWNQYKKITFLTKEDFERKVSRLPRMAGGLLRAMKDYRLLPFSGYRYGKLMPMVQGLKRSKSYSAWAGYHTQVKCEVGDVRTYARFSHVLDILKKLRCHSVTELGANQTELSRRILKELESISAVTCLDIDEGALDLAFCRNSTEGFDMTHAVVDIMAPILTCPKKLPQERFQSEAVIALALTHHLTLGQGFDINTVIRRIREYTTRYALVEFMPYGFDMTFKGLKQPLWYTEDWFRSAFERKFTVLEKKSLETNRILYVGEVRK